MPGYLRRDERVGRPRGRRGFLQAALGTTGLLLLTACGGATRHPNNRRPRPPSPPSRRSPGQPLHQRHPQPHPSPAPAPATGASPPWRIASCRGRSSWSRLAPGSRCSCRAPPQLPLRQRSTCPRSSLSYLGWASFIPTADAFIKKQIEDWAKDARGEGQRRVRERRTTSQPKPAASIQSRVRPGRHPASATTGPTPSSRA